VNRASRLLDLALVGAAIVGVWLGLTLFGLVSR
jgi:hypothetical protein